MASLFVSHSSRDRAAVAAMCARLRAAGFVALFVDFDPEQGIPAGRNWERELYAQLRRTDAVIFLASAASIASRWCFAELSLARSLGRPIFPVRLDPEVWLALLADVQWIDLTDPDLDAGMARLRAGLRAAGLDPANTFGWNPRRCPYPGLMPFEAEDAAVFFGREVETEHLLELLQPTLARGPGRFVAIVGPSGSGKSSLLRAGLLPRLARSPGRWVLLPPLLPGRQPIANLAGCLARAFTAAGAPRPAGELAPLLDRSPASLTSLVEELAEIHQSEASQLGAGRPYVQLVSDKAEEILTRSGPRQQQAFLHLLTGALAALGEDSPLWVVATLRSEFLATAPERAGLAEAIDDPVVIEPLSRARLGEIIARPAQRAGLDLEPGLVERMVEDTAGGDALPLLAYTLRALAERAGPEGHVRAGDYAAVGGVIGALQHRADRLAAELARRGHGPAVVPTLLKLATVTGAGELTRRRIPRSALSGEEQTVVDAFVDARLLTSDHIPADSIGEQVGEQAGTDAVVEVAHEALLRQWPPLRQAIETDRTSLRLRAELERSAADWHQGRRDEAYLLRGARLASIGQWADQHADALSPLDQQFLAASRALASRELETTRRSNRRLRTLAGGLTLFLVAALAAAGLAIRANQRAQEQTRLASSRQLAAQADRLVDRQPDLAILAGLESLSLARGQRSDPSAGLITGLARVTHASRQLAGHAGPVTAVAFSPDGKLLATASRDQTVRLWNMPSGQPHGVPLTGHTNAARGVAFSAARALAFSAH